MTQARPKVTGESRFGSSVGTLPLSAGHIGGTLLGADVHETFPAIACLGSAFGVYGPGRESVRWRGEEPPQPTDVSCVAQNPAGFWGSSGDSPLDFLSSPSVYRRSQPVTARARKRPPHPQT
jgi:hypothetical protein